MTAVSDHEFGALLTPPFEYVLVIVAAEVGSELINPNARSPLNLTGTMLM